MAFSNKCCCCFQIETGIKLIAVITILGTLALNYYTFTDNEYRKAFLPFAITGAIMSLAWIFVFFHDRFWTRRLCFWLYFILIFAFNTIWYVIALSDGRATKYVCMS